MGQPITVVAKPTSRSDVVRFEINRTLSGTGHERYRSAEEAVGPRPVDELARRLFEHGGVDAVHIHSNQITVDLSKGSTGQGLLAVLENLFIHYREGVQPSVVEG